MRLAGNRCSRQRSHTRIDKRCAPSDCTPGAIILDPHHQLLPVSRRASDSDAGDGRSEGGDVVLVISVTVDTRRGRRGSRADTRRNTLIRERGRRTVLRCVTCVIDVAQADSRLIECRKGFVATIVVSRRGRGDCRFLIVQGGLNGRRDRLVEIGRVFVSSCHVLSPR